MKLLLNSIFLKPIKGITILKLNGQDRIINKKFMTKKLDEQKIINLKYIVIISLLRRVWWEWSISIYLQTSQKWKKYKKKYIIKVKNKQTSLWTSIECSRTFRMIAELWNSNTPAIVSRDADLTENYIYMYISMKFGTGVHVFCWEVGVFDPSCFRSVSCKGDQNLTLL